MSEDLTSHRSAMTQRLSSASVRKHSCILISDRVKKNQLKWKFNIRRSKLAKTCQQNVQLYLRIRSQKSGISEMIRKKFSIHQLKTSRPRLQNVEKQNIDFDVAQKSLKQQLKNQQQLYKTVFNCKKYSIRRIL